MPVENLEEEGLEKNPNLELAQKKFLLTTDEYRDDSKLKKELLTAIEQDSKCLKSVMKPLHKGSASIFVESPVSSTVFGL